MKTKKRFSKSTVCLYDVWLSRCNKVYLLIYVHSQTELETKCKRLSFNFVNRDQYSKVQNEYTERAPIST